MQILLLIALVVLGAGVVVRSESKTQIESTPISTPSPTAISPSPKTDPVNTPTSTITPKITKIPTPTIQTTQTPNQPSSDWQYPNSKKISEGSFTSTDSPQQITDWYKNKILSLGYSNKSFVQTSANEKILNKLSAAKNSDEISIEISKNPNEFNTTIKVVLDN